MVKVWEQLQHLWEKPGAGFVSWGCRDGKDKGMLMPRKNPPSHPNGFCWLRGLTQRKWGKELVCIKLKHYNKKCLIFFPEMKT